MRPLLAAGAHTISCNLTSQATPVVDKIGEGTKFGRYALLEKIGTGGMAEIYRAKTYGAAGFEKEFAVKLILPSLVDDSEFVEMFINEAKIAVSLYHANIVQVFDLGEIDGQYYIAMEYVLGKDLLEILARCAERGIKIPLNLVLFVTMEMLKGLNFAHRAKDPFGEDLNIIHRDVSPSNIMISYAGDVKVGDFGVAKAAIQRNLTESGTLKGKVGYMSPEQVMGEEIDARSDIFAAGVVFFEALSMSRMFVGGSDLEVMLQVRDADVDESLEKAEPLPNGLRGIVERALSKHPEERFQTSGEFYQALVDFCYQHSIKVTGTDLSNFMRRLFAEEIEAEKDRRRAEPRPEPEPLDSEASHGSPLEQVAEQLGAPPESIKLKDPEPPEQSAHDGGEPLADSEADQVGRRYRFRDASGLIYGPMTYDKLVGLIDKQDELNGDKVSVDDGPWRDVDDISGLQDVLEADIDETIDDRPDEPAASPPPEAAEPAIPDTQRAAALPEDAELAGDGDEMGGQLKDAVSSLAELSRGLSEVSADGGMETIPFEISSDIFADSSGAEDKQKSKSHSRLDRLAATASEVERDASQTIQELKEQYASYEGQLDTVPFARILARLHRYNATGRLHVQDGSTEKSIFMREGEPILIDSNRKEELLGSFLLEKGRISQDQLEEALARLSEWGGRLGDALVSIGAVDAHEIFELLAEQMREKLVDIFTWSTGRYGYYENQEPDTMGYPLGIDTYSTVVEACRNHIPVDLIHEYYDQRDRVAIHRASNPPVDVDLLKLSSRELRVLTQWEGGMTVARLEQDTPSEHFELTLRTVYLLHQVEILTFETTDTTDLPGDED